MKTTKERLAAALAVLFLLAAWRAEGATLGCAANGLIPESEEYYATLAEEDLFSGESWQVIVGDPLIIAVGSLGGRALWVCQPDGIWEQYYGVADWGTNVWLGGLDGALHYNSPYYDHPHEWNDMVGTDNLFTEGAPQTKTVAGDLTTVTTEMLLGEGAVLKQTLTYEAGDYAYKTRWELKNTSEGAFSDLRFIHGGDTYFGWDDWSRSWYDENRRMLYINNDVFSTSGIMTYRGSEATPADHYFSGQYSEGWALAVEAGMLTDFADDGYVDASTYLEWDRETLAPDATWVIEAIQQVTDPTPIAVIAPVGVSTVNNVTLTLNFIVHNLDEGYPIGGEEPVDPLHTLNLVATSARGWAVEIIGQSFATLDTFEKRAVEVRLTIPEDAPTTVADTITLTATDAEHPGIAGAASTSVAVIASDYALSPTSAIFPRTTVGKTRTKLFTLANDAGGLPVLVGAVGGSDALRTPFTIISDTCSDKTVGAGEACVIEVAFSPAAEGNFEDSFNVPVLSPVTQNWTIRLSGSGMEGYDGSLYDEKINYGCFFEALSR